MESFEHAQNFPPDGTDITGQGAHSPDFETDIKQIRTNTNRCSYFLSVTCPLAWCDGNLRIEILFSNLQDMIKTGGSAVA